MPLVPGGFRESMPTLSQAQGPSKGASITSILRKDALAAALLLLPFLLVAHWLNDLRMAILTFHGTDELIFHYPAILRFAEQWPRPVLGDYSSATTPLFHLGFSLLGKLCGFDLPKLRAVNVLISCGAGLVYFKLLRGHFRHSWAFSLWMSLAFLVSPYFFGVSFLLLTDNLAWLWCMLSLCCFLASLRMPRRPGLAVWALGCTFLCLTLLTRQSFLWLLLSAAAVAWLQTPAVADRLTRVAMLGVAAIPLATLFVDWHGLMPPSFQVAHEAKSLLNPRAFGFTLAVLGLYYPLFNPQRFVDAILKRQPAFMGALAGGLILLVLLPLPEQAVDDGFLWRMARAMPAMHQTPWLFWLLVPLGCAAAVTMLKDAPTSIGTLSLLAFALSVLPSSLLYQKYFDPFIPVFVLLARPPRQKLDKLDMAALAVMTLAFAAYAAMPYMHPDFYSQAKLFN